MKRIMFLNLLMSLALCLTGCGSDDNSADSGIGNTANNQLSVDKTEITIDGDGGSATVTVNADHEWAASVSADWLTVDPKSSTKKGSTPITIKANANKLGAERTAMITVMAGTARQYINVTQAASDDNSMQCPIEGYKLVWHDEFDGNTLSSDWTEEQQSSGWVNNELQNYIKGSSVNDVSNGNLNIHCYKENGKVYSGRVYAKVDKGWQYGYFEARIKLPSGKGTWPAFWMMPVTVDWVNEGWPLCGEIDIMEEVGVVPNEVSSSFHAKGHNHTNNTQITHAMTINKAEGEYHVYALEWTKDRLTTYVDGKVQLSYDNPGTGVVDWPYDKPYYVILNLAWGGSWGGMQGVNESALPVTMNIDYVRVYQK